MENGTGNIGNTGNIQQGNIGNTGNIQQGNTITLATLTQEDFARGFVLTRIGTNEVHDFTAPEGASICEDWKAFGAAEDWVYLEESGVSSQGLGEGVCGRPREPRRKFFVKFAAIGLLALGLIGGICCLLGKKESKDSNDKFEVIEDGMVQLWEGGPYWADKNIGADKPEDDGYYFWWGDTVGYKREGGSWVASDGSMSSIWFRYNNKLFSGLSIFI